MKLKNKIHGAANVPDALLDPLMFAVLVGHLWLHQPIIWTKKSQKLHENKRMLEGDKRGSLWLLLGSINEKKVRPHVKWKRPILFTALLFPFSFLHCFSNISLAKGKNFKCQRYKKLHSHQLPDYSVRTKDSIDPVEWKANHPCDGGCNPQSPRGFVRTSSAFSLYCGCVTFVFDYIQPCRVWIHKLNWWRSGSLALIFISPRAEQPTGEVLGLNHAHKNQTTSETWLKELWKVPNRITFLISPKLSLLSRPNQTLGRRPRKLQLDHLFIGLWKHKLQSLDPLLINLEPTAIAKWKLKKISVLHYIGGVVVHGDA